MRLLYLNGIGQIGGAERVLVDMLRMVRRAQPSWTIGLLLGQDGPLAEQARDLIDDVILVPFPPELARLGDARVGDRQSRPAEAMRIAGRVLAGGATGAAYVRRFRKAIEAFQPDIIHSNSVKMHLLGAWTRPSDSVLIWHLHDYAGSRPLTARLLRGVRRRCSLVIANSTSVAADIAAVLGDNAVPVHTVHNAVDLERFSPDGPSLDLDALAGMPAAAPGVVRVGLVATYALWKGHLTFLEALAKLGPAANVRGYVIGGPLYQTDGSQHTLAELQAAASRLGVESLVGFTGFVPDAASAMRALDVVVHASTAPEPFGLSIAEAMATGRAVVVSYAGGAKELVTPDVDALIHEPGDAAGLAHALEKLAGSEAFRRRLAWAARIAAVERFDPARVQDQLLSLYRDSQSAIGDREMRLQAHAH